MTDVIKRTIPRCVLVQAAEGKPIVCEGRTICFIDSIPERCDQYWLHSIEGVTNSNYLPDGFMPVQAIDIDGFIVLFCLPSDQVERDKVMNCIEKITANNTTYLQDETGKVVQITVTDNDN